jgi:hypothetical protein
MAFQQAPAKQDHSHADAKRGGASKRFMDP